MAPISRTTVRRRVEPSLNRLVRSTAQPFSSSNYLNNIDNVKVPPIFPSARQALYTRYTLRRIGTTLKTPII